MTALTKDQMIQKNSKVDPKRIEEASRMLEVLKKAGISENQYGISSPLIRHDARKAT